MPPPSPDDSKRRSLTSLWVTLGQIFKLTIPYRNRLALALILVLLSSVVWLAVPLGLRALLDAVFEEGNRRLLDLLALGLLTLFLLQAGLGFGGFYHLGWVGERIVADLRRRLYAHLHSLSLRFFADRRLGEITSRLTNDVQAVRTAVTQSLVDLLSHGLSLVGSVGLMVVLNWRMSAIVFLTVPVASLSARYFGGQVRKLSRRVQDELAETTAVAEEALSAVRIVKAFAREPYEIDRYGRAIEELFTTARRRVVLETLFWSLMGLVFLVVLVVIFWYGGIEVLAGRLTPGDLVAFIFYAMNVARSVGMMSRLYTSFNSAAGASERLFELLDMKPDLDDPANPVAIDRVAGAVQATRVSFRYDPDGAQILEDVSFMVNPGQTIALVGPSGAGKTTLLNLIPRFYDTTEGEIRIDGIDVKSVERHALRQHIAVVPQDVHLFNATIAENIRYGRLEADDDEVEDAARAANAHEFILELNDGYAAQVGERGVKLSGGQKQRVAIARALLRDPRILLLDEATSALDSASEALVQQALERLMIGRTTFIIAHRLSTVRHADLILVFDRGKIVERGRHDELMVQDGLYRTLAELQFRESESYLAPRR